MRKKFNKCFLKLLFLWQNYFKHLFSTKSLLGFKEQILTFSINFEQLWYCPQKGLQISQRRVGTRRRLPFIKVSDPQTLQVPQFSYFALRSSFFKSDLASFHNFNGFEDVTQWSWKSFDDSHYFKCTISPKSNFQNSKQYCALVKCFLRFFSHD